MAEAFGSVVDALLQERSPSLHDSARASPELLNSFDALIRDINRILGPCNGIDSNDVDVRELEGLMTRYKSCEGDWDRYAFADMSRCYTRNLIDHGNGKCNILILVWTPGRGSPIHDHANAHCVMKILRGSLTETVYAWPCQSISADASCAGLSGSVNSTTEHTCSASWKNAERVALQVQRSATYGRDKVTYMSDRVGLHRVSNPSTDEVAVSLHLYTPPNAAKHGCHVFDERTGKKSHVQQCHFYSELGVKK